jgi:yecA family protein
MPKSLPTGRRPPRPPDDPLNPAEIELLDLILMQSHGDIVCFEELDGFITAVSIAPMLVLPRACLDYILDEESSDDAEWNNTRAQAVILVLRHWKDVRRGLRRSWPRAIRSGPSSEEEPQGAMWAHGFLLGLDWLEEDLDGHLTDELREGPVALITALADQAGKDPHNPKTNGSGQREALLRQVATAVAELQREFRSAG